MFLMKELSDHYFEANLELPNIYDLYEIYYEVKFTKYTQYNHWDVANTGFVIQELDSVQFLHDIIFYL